MRLSVLSFYSGYVHRGVEVYAQNLKKYLSNHQIDIISAPKINWHKSFTRQIAQFTHQALSQLESNPPDIIYPLNNGWQSALCKIFCFRHKTKLVLAGHSGLGRDDKLNLWLCPDMFICFSQAQARWAKSVNPWARIRVIPHGVDLEKFNPQVKPKKLPFKKPIFVTVSALSPQGRAGDSQKNIELTIQAMAKLKNASLLLQSLCEQWLELLQQNRRREKALRSSVLGKLRENGLPRHGGPLFSRPQIRKRNRQHLFSLPRIQKLSSKPAECSRELRQAGGQLERSGPAKLPLSISSCANCEKSCLKSFAQSCR